MQTTRRDEEKGMRFLGGNKRTFNQSVCGEEATDDVACHETIAPRVGWQGDVGVVFGFCFGTYQRLSGGLDIGRKEGFHCGFQQQ